MRMFLIMILSQLMGLAKFTLWIFVVTAWVVITYKVYQEYYWLWAVVSLIVGLILASHIYNIGQIVITFIGGWIGMAISPKELRDNISNLMDEQREEKD